MEIIKFKIVKEKDGCFLIHSVWDCGRDYTEVYNRNRKGTIINNGLEAILEALEGIEFKIEGGKGYANQCSKTDN